MEISFTFKLDADERANKLKRAEMCAEEMSTLQCSWHNKHPQVTVALDDAGELKWLVADLCCEDFGRALATSIEEITPRL